MKTVKKALAVILCVAMFATNIIVAGVAPMINAVAVKGENQVYSDARLDLNFNKNWNFNLGDESGAQEKIYDDSAWEKVDLPHDFSIIQDFTYTGTEGESGCLPGGTGWYRKWFTMDAYYAGKSIVLNFDGAYQHTYVYVNGTFVGENHYGYNNFSFDITDYVVCTNDALNLIAVKVVHELPSSRWYSGSGIYRDVTMTITNPLHIAPYGTQIKTPNLATDPTDGSTEAIITLQNDNNAEQTVDVTTAILDENGAEVVAATSEATVAANAQQSVTLNPSVSNPTLWSVDNPYVYTLKTTVTSGDTVIDEYYTDFGYRYFNWDVDTGFSLNGEKMKLKGVCMHSDQGALGAVQAYDAIYRQMSIMKDMGVNAIRTAHNTPSEIVLDVCNELGILVMEEFFDGWSASKNGNSKDFSTHFLQEIGSSNQIIGGEADMLWYEFALRQSVMRDRNAPCVFSWDIGNELTAEGNYSNYPTYAQNMYDIITELDGDDHRPVCIGNNRPGQDVANSINDIMDITGGNYHLNNTTEWLGAARDATKPFVASESASAVNGRGIYDTTNQYNYQCTAYDSKCVGWGNYAAEAWYHAIVNDWFSGEFVWTGFDYIGEPTPWNPTTNAVAGQPVSSFFGIADTAGFAKDSYYLYRSWWNENSNTVHLVPGSWVQSELALTNGYAHVAVYSNAKRIELLLNDNVIATATSNTVTTDAGFTYQTWTESVSDSSKCKIDSPLYTDYGADFYPQFQVLFEAGTLSVKAYDESGNEITDASGSQKSVTTSATKINATVWNNIYTYTADGQRYAYVEFEAQDANGNFVNDYNGTLNISIDDQSSRYAEIVGVDNGNAATDNKFQHSSVLTSASSATIQMFNGKALAILRTTEEEGTINVTANATNNGSTIQANGVTVTSVSETEAELSDEFEEVIIQREITYTPTLHDKYVATKTKVENLDSSHVNSTLYTRLLVGINEENLVTTITDGEYIITGQSNPSSYTNGVMTHQSYGTGGGLRSTNAEATVDSDKWQFEWRSGTGYNIFFVDDNGARQYFDIVADVESPTSDDYYVTLVTAEPDTGFDIEINSDGTVKIKKTGTSMYINYSGNTNNKVTTWTTATNLTIYKVEGTNLVTWNSTGESTVDVAVPDGDYAICNSKGTAHVVMTGTADTSGTGLTHESVADTISDDLRTFDTSDANEFTITHVSDDLYTILHKNSGQYLNIGSGNSTVSLSNTAQNLTIKPRGDGSVYIYNGAQFLDNFGSKFDSWSSSESSNNANEILYLYTAPVSTDYTRYDAVVSSVSTDAYMPDGQYIITGASTDGYSKGVLTATTHSSGNGLATDGSTGTPTSSAFQWTVTKQSNGAYYISADVNGTTKYLTISGGHVWVSDTASATQYLYFVDCGNEKFDIHNTNQAGYVNYYGGQTNKVDRWSDGGNHLTLYKVDGTTVTKVTSLASGSGEITPPVADDSYVILSKVSNGPHLMGAGTSSGTSYTFPHAEFTLADDELTLQTDAANEFTFISQGEESYYIQAANGQYLTIGTSNSSLALSDTPAILTVHAASAHEVIIYSGSQFIDNHNNQGKFSTWSGTVSGASANRKFVLYKEPDVVDAGSVAAATLLTAMQEAMTHSPEHYTAESFQALLDAVEYGITLYSSGTATQEELLLAAEDINATVEELEIDIKKHPATLFKYGYDNTNGQDYNAGGSLINEIAINRMAEMIAADANLVSQIKTLIDYDGTEGTVWDEGKADAALQTAINRYAELYSLHFTGNTVTDQAAPSNFHKTAWNNWSKNNTQGANESKDEGASVQGLVSSTLVDGELKSHAAYSVPLPYINQAPSNSITELETITVVTSVATADDGTETETTKEVTLDALSGISVYSPDLFDKELLLADDTVTTETTGEYAKYYWDTAMPFLVATDEYGVNTYSYDSSATDYLLRTHFDDETHSAVMDIQPVEAWALVTPSGSQKGFFPFNYQSDGASAHNTTGTTSEFGNQKAIYHFGLNFETDFYIPSSGTYANGEDIVFSFTGDDDVYVYIDGVLVLDNGGLHAARTATINFTDCSLNYQYAIDVTEGVVKDTTEFGTTYTYGAENEGISADNLAALEKLHEVRTGGGQHTFTFFFLERGSTASNCKISFNLAETSEDVKLSSQVLTVDYALPLEYDIKSNNILSSLAVANNAHYEYIGITEANTPIESAVAFEKPTLSYEFTDSVTTLDVTGLKYGTGTITKDGLFKFRLNTNDFTSSDYFYVCAMVTGDPTYAQNSVYYQYEKVTLVPATTIYIEDTFNTITYTDGSTPAGYTNTNEYGIWKQDGTQPEALKQTADIVDSQSKPYGYEVNYQNFATYSGGSAHFVDVSTRNNPNKKFSGGTGAAWPKMSFNFTGTGFDLISLTDDTTGAFEVNVYKVNDDGTTTRIERQVTDTYYGYSYGRLYSDASGNPTLVADGNTPMYKSNKGLCTSTVMYYNVNGALSETPAYLDISGTGYTDTPTYYDADGNITEEVTDNPAYSYAYAYGWMTDTDSETLYQIPVIKILDLEYGKYKVDVIPTFTSMFGHNSVDANGDKYYRVYFDAVRIYEPAGVDDEIADKVVSDAYKTDDEMYPSFIEMKEVLIGSNSLSEDSTTQGVIFIDGIAASDNNIEVYKKAGPNNELYLAKDQAVAFEIWATAVPTDIQIGAKLAFGNPNLSIIYNANETKLPINSASDIYYSFNNEMPAASKLTWQQTESNGEIYYTSGTVVIQNTGDAECVLSITNLKWTFSQYGEEGYFRIPTSVENEEVVLMTSALTEQVAYASMNMLKADLDVTAPEENSPVVSKDENGNSIVTMKVTTSTDVHSLVIKDENGNTVEPTSVESVINTVDNKQVKEWTVTLVQSEAGTHTFLVSGAYENGYTGDAESVEFTVTIEEEKLPDEGTPDEGIPDEGTPDEGTPDEGTPDEGTPDEGTPDEEPPVVEEEKTLFDYLVEFVVGVYNFLKAFFEKLLEYFNIIL